MRTLGHGDYPDAKRAVEMPDHLLDAVEAMNILIVDDSKAMPMIVRSTLRRARRILERQAIHARSLQDSPVTSARLDAPTRR